MEKEQADIIKKIESSIKTVKDAVYYTNDLKASVKQSRFENIGEDDYNDRLKDTASKKANLVVLLSQNDNFKLWSENAPEKSKNFLYDLAKTGSLNVNQDDRTALAAKDVINYSQYNRTVIKLNDQYSDTKADFITNAAKEQFKVSGEKHLAVQLEAEKVIAPLRKDGPEFQKVTSILFEKVGDKYNEVLDSFKSAARNKELEKDGNGFILTTKALGAEQKFKFSVDDKNKVTDITAVPPNISFIVERMRQNNNTFDNNKKMTM